MQIRYLLCFVFIFMSLACSQAQTDDSIHSFFSGTIKVNPEFDASTDFSGYHILVGLEDGSGKIDTLGYAVTDNTGKFAINIKAKEKGVFPVYLLKRGELLGQGEIVVAEADSATLSVVLPLQNKVFHIRSTETSAWKAYQNLRIQHNQSLLELAQSGENSLENMEQVINRTANMMWNLEEAYPSQTFGVQLAKAEAIVMLEGWDDKKVLFLGSQVSPNQAGFVEIAKASRRAKSRIEGQVAAIALMRSMRDKLTDPEKKAVLLADIIQAYIDSTDHDKALDAIEELKQENSNENWQNWAAKAAYEVNNLLPGLKAPKFSALTPDAKKIDLEDYRGNLVILEFWDPRSQIFQQQVGQLEEIKPSLQTLPITWISFSLAQNRALNDAFFEGRDIPGIQIYETDGFESSIAKLYNINILPTRFLIDGEGTIIRKYPGNALGAMISDLNAIFESLETK